MAPKDHVCNVGFTGVAGTAYLRDRTPAQVAAGAGAGRTIATASFIAPVYPVGPSCDFVPVTVVFALTTLCQVPSPPATCKVPNTDYFELKIVLTGSVPVHLAYDTTTYRADLSIPVTSL